jgi:ABC-2 type transport system permease protein
LFQRIFSISLKEIIELLRDRRSFVIILFVPLLQLFIFGYALSTDVKNVPLVIWDSSKSSQSRELIQAFDETEFFAIQGYADDYDQIQRAIDGGVARVALIIPSDYATKLLRGEQVEVQVFIDGSETTTALQALSSSALIAQAKSVALASARSGGLVGMVLPIDLQARVWYNPAMQAAVFNIPGLIGVIAQVLTSMLTAFSVVRERETGTIEQLNVTPLRRGELIVGKLIPYVVIAYIQVILVLLVAVTVFGIVIQGNVWLLLALTSPFLLFSLGLGLLFSTISRTQFQAQQLSFAFTLPSILLSGFMYPIASMPPVAQWISTVIPLTYYLNIVRGIIVKGIGFAYLWQDVLILLVFGVLTLVIAATRLRKTLG